LIGLPSRTRWRGVSRFEPNQPWRRARRRKAKSGLHPSMQAVRLSRWRSLHFHANSDSGACSLGQDRGHPASRKTPAAFHRSDEFSSLSSNPCGCSERNDLLPYRVFGMRARTCQQRGQHARKPLFTESCPACQGQNSDQIADRAGPKFGPEMARKFLLPAPSHRGRLARLGRRRFPCDV